MSLETERYSENFWAFSKELGIVPDLQEQPHRELVDFLLDEGSYKLILVPRDSFKTTTIGVAFTLWELCKNPNLRILIDSRTVDRAKEILFQIKQHLERNERFKEVFGDWKYIPGWREESFVHPRRTRKLREPSIKVAGIDAPVTGGHYDIIIADDLMDESNSQTEVQCNKAWLHLQTLFPILEPHGTLVVVGTVWSYMDIYARITEEQAHLGWQVLRRPAINAQGELWFPARLTQEYLDDRRQKMGPYLFSAQFMLEATAPEDRRFEKDWIQYKDCYVESNEGRVSLVVDGRIIPVFITLAVDPAISDKKGGDFSGLVTVASDPFENWYVLAARRVRGGAQNLINEILKEIRDWRVGIVGVETVAYQKALKEFLQERLYQEGLLVGISELISGTGRGKRARIEGLVPKFAEGRVVLRQGMGTELEFELLQWTPDREMRHDDLIDALSHQLDLSEPAPMEGQKILGSEWFDLPPDERKRVKAKRDEELEENRRPSAGWGY